MESWVNVNVKIENLIHCVGACGRHLGGCRIRLSPISPSASVWSLSSNSLC
jgi:hypothetical protein